MNLQSEIEYFAELAVLDKARLLNSFLHELAARKPAPPMGPAPRRCMTRCICGSSTRSSSRLTRLIEQFLAEDAARPAGRRGAAHALVPSGGQGGRAPRSSMPTDARFRVSRATTPPCLMSGG